MKVVVNAWLVALVEGLAESVALAEGIGADPAKFLEIIDGGPVGPPYAKLKGTIVDLGDLEPGTYTLVASGDLEPIRITIE